MKQDFKDQLATYKTTLQREARKVLTSQDAMRRIIEESVAKFIEGSTREDLGFRKAYRGGWELPYGSTLSKEVSSKLKPLVKPIVERVCGKVAMTKADEKRLRTLYAKTLQSEVKRLVTEQAKRDAALDVFNIQQGLRLAVERKAS